MNQNSEQLTIHHYNLMHGGDAGRKLFHTQEHCRRQWVYQQQLSTTGLKTPRCAVWEYVHLFWSQRSRDITIMVTTAIACGKRDSLWGRSIRSLKRNIYSGQAVT